MAEHIDTITHVERAEQALVMAEVNDLRDRGKFEVDEASAYQLARAQVEATLAVNHTLECLWGLLDEVGSHLVTAVENLTQTVHQCGASGRRPSGERRGWS